MSTATSVPPPIPPAPSQILTAAERSLRVALLLSAAGGFLDAFTYVGHGGEFANVMTGNIVFLALFVASGKWKSALLVIPPILAFLLGVLLVYRLRHPSIHRPVRRPALACLGLEIVFLAVASTLPASFPDVLLVPGIALVAAMQNSSFTSVESSAYNSVMTTGNLRRFAESLCAGLIFKRDWTALREARIFGMICVAFAFGAGVGALATRLFLNLALWIPVTALAVAFYLCWTPRNPAGTGSTTA